MKITAAELRQKYLDFFKSKWHAIIKSASLIPENDATTLFTTAGMHPLVPYLIWEKHPAWNCLTNIQKCIRTDDIDEVWDFTHHTFFEMLWNWSLGDYFKKESIEWSYEFLTSEKWLNLDKNRIAVSVFVWDKDSSFDNEAFEVWKNLWISEKRIAKLPKKNNWWGLETWPCWPDTEIFYWVWDIDKIPESFNDDHPNWVEIWNNVFMQYYKKEDKSLEPLKQKNVDTWMWFERTLAIINGFDDNYKTELFTNIILKIEELSNKKYDFSSEIKKAIRIIADHIKAATFIIWDDKWIAPSNLWQGYIVRRLIRRAIRYWRQLWIKKTSWIGEIWEVVINDYKSSYEELERNKKFILDELKKEEDKFEKTLQDWIKEFEKLIKWFSIAKEKTWIAIIKISWDKVFKLYDTFGFPIEMTEELAKENCLEIDKEWFKVAFEKHQELSRTASAGTFKWWLADSWEETKKLHTAAHLMLAWLRNVLWDKIFQKWSNITAERLRFDFSYNDRMTAEQIKQVEDFVNSAIQDKLPINCEEMSLEEAKIQWAMWVFESKYSEKVKVYTIWNDQKSVSKEICGWPHVTNTWELWKFKIIKEESSSSWVRRIKAVLEN